MSQSSNDSANEPKLTGKSNPSADSENNVVKKDKMADPGFKSSQDGLKSNSPGPKPTTHGSKPTKSKPKLAGKDAKNLKKGSKSKSKSGSDGPNAEQSGSSSTCDLVGDVRTPISRGITHVMKGKRKSQTSPDRLPGLSLAAPSAKIPKKQESPLFGGSPGDCTGHELSELDYDEDEEEDSDQPTSAE